MKFYISYFYNIRFFPKNLIPVSTAVWDPKWYHMDKGNDYIYIDKRGVINGVRCRGLSPYKIHSECSNDCPLKEGKSCSFIEQYKQYLHSLDFTQVIYLIEHEVSKLRKDCDVCLIVYEKPDNPCSERGPLIEWFNENCVELIEWEETMVNQEN